MRFAALGIIVSTLATQFHFVLSQPLSALNQPAPVYLYGAGMALFSTVLPVFWQSAAVQRIGAARTVLIGTLGPILTIFFAWLLLAEPVSLAQLAGAGLVLAGVLLVARRAAPAQPHPVAGAAAVAGAQPASAAVAPPGR
ncbi:EamA-like transporter family protein [compost metagenome]